MLILALRTLLSTFWGHILGRRWSHTDRKHPSGHRLVLANREMLVTFLVIVVSFESKEGVAGILEVLLNSFTSNSHLPFLVKDNGSTLYIVLVQ